MGTGGRLFGNPTCCDQLLDNISAIFGNPHPYRWPGVEQLPRYQQFGSPAVPFAEAAETAESEEYWHEANKALSLLEHPSGLTPGSKSPVQSCLPPDLVAVALAVQSTLILNPAKRLSATAVSAILASATQVAAEHSRPLPPPQPGSFFPQEATAVQAMPGPAAATAQLKRERSVGAPTKPQPIRKAPNTGLDSDSDEEAGWKVARTAISKSPADHTQSGAGPSGETQRYQHRGELCLATPVKLERSPGIPASSSKLSAAKSSSLNYVTTRSIPPGCSSIISENMWQTKPADANGLFWVYDSNIRGPRLAQILPNGDPQL